MRVSKNLNTHKFIIVAVNIIGLIYLLVISFLYFGTLPVDKYNDTTEYFIYTKDTSISTLSNLWALSSDLKKAGIIRNKYSFFTKAFIDGNYYHYPEKEYAFSKAMGVNDILSEMSSSE